MFFLGKLYHMVLHFSPPSHLPFPDFKRLRDFPSPDVVAASCTVGRLAAIAGMLPGGGGMEMKEGCSWMSRDGS